MDRRQMGEIGRNYSVENAPKRKEQLAMKQKAITERGEKETAIIASKSTFQNERLWW
jgi:hypothetical protein